MSPEDGDMTLKDAACEVLLAWDQDSTIYDRESNLHEAIEQLRRAVATRAGEKGP